jgi:hypothetical protein
VALGDDVARSRAGGVDLRREVDDAIVKLDLALVVLATTARSTAASASSAVSRRWCAAAGAAEHLGSTVTPDDDGNREW